MTVEEWDTTLDHSCTTQSFREITGLESRQLCPRTHQWIQDSEKAQVNWTLNKPDLCTNAVGEIINS